MSQTNFNKRIPVALNFSGGISLGSYMAGIFYELTKEALKDDSKIVIDIITGASAGANTAVLAAYYLLDAEPLPDYAPESLFYQAWVNKVDINSISAVGKGPEVDPETKHKNWSLLSGKAIQDISKELVGKFTDNIDKVIQSRHQKGKKEAIRPLALLITLTNLQGFLKKTKVQLSHKQDTNNENTIETVTSAETRQFLFYSGLSSEKDKLDAMWKKAELSSRASGAFPVAFPPIGDKSEFGSPNLASLSDKYFVNPLAEPEDKILNQEQLGAICKDDKHLAFQYTDGGILDGLPIVKSIVMENMLLNGDKLSTVDYPGLKDPNFPPFRDEWIQLSKDLGLNYEDRLYVYIQPTPANDLKSQDRLLKGKFSMAEVGLSGLTLSKAEHDAIRLEEIRQHNKDFEHKQLLKEKIQEIFDNSDDNLRNSFKKGREELEQLIDEAIPFRHIKLCRIDPSLIARFLKGEAFNKYETVKQALEESLTPYMKEAIASGNEEKLLASDFLGAFGGFFDKRYREHDFLLGRICGQIWLLENCWGAIDESSPNIKHLVDLIKTDKSKFLKSDPKPSDLVLSGQIGILEDLVWRTLRILFMKESNNRDEETSDQEQAGRNLINLVLRNIAIKAFAFISLAIVIPIVIVVFIMMQILFSPNIVYQLIVYPFILAFILGLIYGWKKVFKASRKEPESSSS